MDELQEHKELTDLQLNSEETKLLVDVIDIHIQGIREAKPLTTDDPTVESAEQLLDLMSGYDDDLKVLERIKAKLLGDE